MTPTLTRVCHARVFNLAMEEVARIGSATNVWVTQNENEIWTAGFRLPASDPANAHCLDCYYVELYDSTGTRIELFRIVESDETRDGDELSIAYTLEHVLGTLVDDKLIGVHTAGPGTTATINYVLGEQLTARWQLVTCDFARNFLHTWKNQTLLAALNEISDQLVDETWQWTFDTASYPWTLNLIEPSDDVIALIDYRRNMKEIRRNRAAGSIVNRLYAWGNGSETDQLTIRKFNITGAQTTVAVEADPEQLDVTVADGSGFSAGENVYIENAAGEWEANTIDSKLGNVLTLTTNLLHTYAIGSTFHVAEDYVEDAASQALYGIKIDVWDDQRYTDAQSLYDAAVAKLATLKVPPYTYSVEAIDQWPLIGKHKLELGGLVRVRDNDLGILIDSRVTSLKKRDVFGRPDDVTVQLDNRVPTFGDSYGQIIYADDLDGVSDGGTYAKVYSTQILAGKILLSAVPGGPIGPLPNPPSVAGSYLSAEYIGIHDGANWITYMDNAARLIADDGTGDAYFRWDPTLIGSAKLQIKGDVSVTGTISATQISGGILDFAAISREGLSVLVGELAGGITSAKLSISQLSSISGNFGTITAGSVTSVAIRTASSGQRVALNTTVGWGGENHCLSAYDASRERARLSSGGLQTWDTSGNLVCAMWSLGASARGEIRQTGAAAGIPALILQQNDASEGFIDLLGSDRGVIAGGTASVGSVRAEMNGVVRRLALYADA